MAAARAPRPFKKKHALSPQHRSILLLIVTMIIWGSTFVVTKEIIHELQPYTLAFARVFIGALVLGPFAWVRRPPRSATPWGLLVTLGFVGVAFYYAAFNLSLTLTSAVQGALVQSSIPAATALVAVLWFGERATLMRWLGIALSMAGVIIVFTGGDNHGSNAALIGNLLMFLTVISWGVYTSLVKRLMYLDAVFVTASLMVIGSLLLAPLAAYEIAAHGAPAISLKGLAGLLWLGVLASGVAYMLYNNALRHMDASQAGAYTNLIPIVGVITGVVVLGEPLTARAILGGAVVMLGVWVASRGSGAEKRRVTTKNTEST